MLIRLFIAIFLFSFFLAFAFPDHHYFPDRAIDAAKFASIITSFLVFITLLVSFVLDTNLFF